MASVSGDSLDSESFKLAMRLIALAQTEMQGHAPSGVDQLDHLDVSFFTEHLPVFGDITFANCTALVPPPFALPHLLE